MARTETYDVLRQHIGDGNRLYVEGEQCQAQPADVKRLVEMGVLRKRQAARKPAEKAAKATANKAAPALENK